MTATDGPARPTDHPSVRVDSKSSASPIFTGFQPEHAPESVPLAGSGGPAPASQHGAHQDRAVLAGAAQLGVRELAIIESLSQHAFLTADHIRRLHFTEHATLAAASRICRHVLQRMARQRLIEHLDRRIGGIRAGSSSYVWRLGLAGDRLVRLQRGDGVRARRKEPSVYYLDHRLAVAEIDVRLREADRAGLLDLLQVEPEPHTWRRFLVGPGTRLILKPDLFAVTASSEYEDRFFIEVDRGTESIPTLIRKCAVYESYRKTGSEQQAHGVFPLVVWQLPNQARVAKLRAAIRAARSLDERLYRMTTPDQLLPLILAGGEQ